MTEVIVKTGGEVTLPAEVCRRYGMNADSKVRLIETRSGVLLVPLTSDPMDPVLRDELQQWQMLGVESWDQFPFEGPAP